MGYNIYIAKIVGVTNNGDDRLQVRVLPQMEDTSAIPDGRCPVWSYFFKGQVISGKLNDLVWVICNDDFSSGYILGYANYTTICGAEFTKGKVYSSDVKDTNFSIPSSLKENISNIMITLLGVEFSYNDIIVSFWNDTSIHFIERTTGGQITAFQSGALYVFRPDLCLCMMGKNNGIKITSDGVSIVGKTVKIESSDVLLGNNPIAKVMVTESKTDTAPVASLYVKA